MILLKVILHNIRSHEYLEFEPALEGLTVISGKNGAGKSTIINSFAWSLFGVKAQGVKVKDYIREGVDPKDDFVGVQSYILVGNREYKIERKILSKAGGSACSVYSRPINSDDEYILDSGPGTAHSESFIRNLLGFDEKGFYSSAFIQQKQVDLIVSAGPRERGSIIEKMIGVSSITEALSMAREESRGLQRALSIIQLGSVEEQEKKVEEQKDIVLKLNDELNQILEESKKVNSEVENITEQFNSEKEKQEQLVVLQQELALKNNDKKNIGERLDAQIKILDSSESEDILFSEDFYERAKGELEKIKKEFIDSSKGVAVLENKCSELQTILDEKIDKHTPKIYEEKSKQQDIYRKQIEDYNVQLMSLKQDLKRAKDFSKDLEDNIATCPYCHSEIKDLDEEKVKNKNTIDELNKEAKNVKSFLKKAQDDSDKILNELVDLQPLLDTLSKQQGAKAQYDSLQKDLRKLKSKSSSQEKVLNIQEQQFEKLTALKEQAKNINVTKATIKMLNETLSSLGEEIKQNEDEIDKLNALNKKDYKELESKYNKLIKKQTEINLHLVDTQKNLEIAKVTGKNLLNELKAQKKAAQDYSKISHQLSILHQSIQALTEFKEIRTKTSIPSLSNIASDILSQFTDGAFNKFILNENFETSVVTFDGKERDISILSGGEESTAAIALRLSIALFLSEGTKSLLVLDEILASMDDDRQQLILETIKELPNSQIILVAHSQVANSYADQLFQL